jgi:predicted alpha/beta hydrolase family esterase
LIREAAEGPVHVVGHSLGGILGALAAASLSSQTVASVTVVSSPWDAGTRNRLSGFLRFLLAKGLLPGYVVRQRFFGPGVPAQVQKDVFRTAVPEAEELKELITRRPWFHVETLPRPFPHPLLVIGSEADRVVGIEESVAFALTLGGQLERIAKARGWGHDDPAVEPSVAQDLIHRIEKFISQLPERSSTTAEV